MQLGAAVFLCSPTCEAVGKCSITEEAVAKTGWLLIGQRGVIDLRAHLRRGQHLVRASPPAPNQHRDRDQQHQHQHDDHDDQRVIL